MGRLRVWLFHLLSRLAVSPPEDPLPRPTPGEIMAVRVLIPVEGDRTPPQKVCITMFRLGYLKRKSEEQSPFKPMPLTPQTSGSVAVFVDKTGQQQAQREMTQPAAPPVHLGMRSRAMTRELRDHPGILKAHHARMLQQKDITHQLDHTPTETLPSVKMNRPDEAAPVPRKVFQTRKLTALPEPTPIFEEDRFLLDTNDVTERREVTRREAG